MPVEVRRVIELLNRQMDSMEVLAVELRSYEGGGTRVLVPQAVGMTERSRAERAAWQPRPEP